MFNFINFFLKFFYSKSRIYCGTLHSSIVENTSAEGFFKKNYPKMKKTFILKYSKIDNKFFYKENQRKEDYYYFQLW